MKGIENRELVCFIHVFFLFFYMFKCMFYKLMNVDMHCCHVVFCFSAMFLSLVFQSRIDVLFFAVQLGVSYFGKIVLQILTCFFHKHTQDACLLYG